MLSFNSSEGELICFSDIISRKRIIIKSNYFKNKVKF